MIIPRSRPQGPTGNRSRDLAAQVERATTATAAGAALGHMLAKDRKTLRNAEAYLQKHAGSRKARRAARRLAGAFKVKLAHVANAARKGPARRAPEGTSPRPMSPAEIVRLAEGVRPNRPTAERITMRAEAKRPKPGDVPRLVDPKHVRVASQVLGHRHPATTERHYNLATSVEATRQWQNLLDRLRASSDGPGPAPRVKGPRR